MTTAPAVRIRYEGPGIATEIWGASQANFLVAIPGQHAKEVAIVFSDAAASYLAEQLGVMDSPAFRADVARVLGQLILERRLATGEYSPPAVVVSRVMLIDDRSLVEAARSAFAA